MDGIVAGKPMCLYYDGEYREDDADFEPCFPVKPQAKGEGVDVHELPGGECVSLCHLGPYELLGRSYAKLVAHAKSLEREVLLPTREIYLKGPGMIFRGSPDKYLTEIQLFMA